MFKNGPRALLRVAAATAAVIGPLVASPAIAAAATTTQAVAGKTQSDIAISIGTPVAGFTTNFQPGGSATTSGTLVATDTSATPTLQVADATSTTNKGHMQAAAAGCTGSEAVLANALSVTVPSGGGLTSAGPISISGTNQNVATASAPIAAATVTTNYTQNINAGETLLTDCVYNITNTYTLS